MNGASISRLHQMRREGHHRCLVCAHPELKLNFALEGPHRLRSSVDFTDDMVGFNGMIHDGILALLLDEAVTCALLAEGHYAATADLSLRYLHPVKPAPTAHIFVSTLKRARELFETKAELHQENRLCTRATARMMKQPLRISHEAPTTAPAEPVVAGAGGYGPNIPDLSDAYRR